MLSMFFRILVTGLFLVVMAAAAELPQGVVLEIRLTRSLGSYESREGSIVEGVLIAPVRAGGRSVLPLGTRITGIVRQSRRIGWGLWWETARMQIEFNQLELPGGPVGIEAQLVELDNARERVDEQGRIRGIRSTASLANSAANVLSGLAMADPMTYLFVNVSSSQILRFPEPEIHLPQGAELSAKVLKTVQLPDLPETHVPEVAVSDTEQVALQTLVHNLPFRTETQKTHAVSDITNLVFIGSREAVERAFTAAGWVTTDALSGRSIFYTLRSVAENQGYQAAPMSTLLLDGQAPEFTWSKTLNTFAKRHHARVFPTLERWQGERVWTSSSTQDIGIAVSRKQKTFIHVIDEVIDNERDKIVNDLLFTGCVSGVELLERPWIPMDAKNSTGDNLKTDGAAAIVRLNECLNPVPASDPAIKDVRVAGNRTERGLRQASLVIRNDLLRGNLIWTGGAGIYKLVQMKKAKPAAARANVEVDGIRYSSWRGINLGGVKREKPTTGPVLAGEVKREWSAPLFEFGVEGGGMRVPTSDLGGVILAFMEKQDPTNFFLLGLGSELGGGWAAGITVTLNWHRYFSSEWGASYQRGKFKMPMIAVSNEETSGIEMTGTGLLTHQFHYGFLAHLRPRERRFRPYVSVGPALQLLHLTDAPIKKSNKLFKVGLRNVGLLMAMYNFSREPPLDGGGIFQMGLQYGAGVKYQVKPHFQIRLDFRETLSPQPDFLRKSFQEGITDLGEYTMEIQRFRESGPLRQQRLTAGFSFTF